MNERDIQRFWAGVQKSDGCWEWMRSRTRGYGGWWWEGKVRQAHRTSWELHRGPIPAGMTVRHRCGTPPCVNPDHLFLSEHAWRPATAVPVALAPPYREGWTMPAEHAAARRHLEGNVTPEPNTGCWLWTGPANSNGYAVIKVANKRTNGQRAAWLFYKGPIPDGMWVLHKCDVPCCVNPDHLFLGTSDDNIADMVAKQRQRAPMGTKSWYAKLTEEQVKRIRLDGRRYHIIAADFRMSRSAIARIKQGRQWRHV